MLLAIVGVTFLVLLAERRAAAVIATAARLDPRARSGMRECRLALPGLVDAVAAGLSSGLSVQLALCEVAPTLPRALALPTERAAAAMVLGASVDDAVGAYAGVVAGEDLAPFAIVLGAFARSGGKIGRSLARVATLLRGRIALEDERSALTAQGRASAMVLVAVAPLPEARRLLADLALGRGASEAFAAFGSAGPTEARVAALVRAATRFGSPLASLLVTQADALRASDRRRAESQARRLPVLMLFPLAVCVLPALLCVFLGPPLLSLLA